MSARVTSRARVTAIPAILASAAFASIPGVLQRAAAHGANAQATPDAASQWGSLGLPELDLTFTSDAVSGMPESVEAGRYLITIHGEPTPEDYAFGPLFLQVPDDMTTEEFIEAASTAMEGPPPDFLYSIVIAGGPSILAGTGATSATGVIDLPPGEWLVAGSGLSQPPSPFTVTGEMPEELPEPESTVTLTIGEMVIEISEGEFVAGENLVKIENIGAQPHFVEVSKVPDGTTEENIEATIAGFMGGTPEAEPIAEEDFVPVANSSDQSGGTVMWMTLTAEPGTHSATCWIPDPESGMPHAAMGMYTVFTVE